MNGNERERENLQRNARTCEQANPAVCDTNARKYYLSNSTSDTPHIFPSPNSQLQTAHEQLRKERAGVPCISSPFHRDATIVGGWIFCRESHDKCCILFKKRLGSGNFRFKANLHYRWSGSCCIDDNNRYRKNHCNASVRYLRKERTEVDWICTGHITSKSLHQH